MTRRLGPRRGTSPEGGGQGRSLCGQRYPQCLRPSVHPSVQAGPMAGAAATALLFSARQMTWVGRMIRTTNRGKWTRNGRDGRKHRWLCKWIT